MASIYHIKPSRTVASVLEVASTADRLVVHGDHSAEGVVSVSKAVDIVNGGDAVLDQLVYATGSVGGCVDGVRFYNVTANPTYRPAVILHDPQKVGILNVEIEGNGYTHGIAGNTNYLASEVTIEAAEIHAIEGPAVQLLGDGHVIQACNIYAQQRIYQSHTYEPDAINLHGSNAKILHNKIDMVASSVHEAGGAGQRAPHNDVFQFYGQQTATSEPIPGRNIEIGYNTVTGEAFMFAAFQGLDEPTSILSALDVHHNVCEFGDRQAVLVQGVVGADITDNIFIFRGSILDAMVVGSSATNGNPDNLNVRVLRNRLFTPDGTTLQEFVTMSSGLFDGLEERNNFRFAMNGDTTIESDHHALTAVVR